MRLYIINMSGCNSIIRGRFREAAKNILYARASRTRPVDGQDQHMLTVYKRRYWRCRSASVAALKPRREIGRRILLLSCS